MNRLKERIRAGEFVTAAWAELGSPDCAEILVDHGWDVIVIDGEHGIGDLEQWVAVARTVEAAGGDAVLRVPEGSEALLKRVLDRGFKSILVPQVNTVAHAEAVAASCRYPGVGRRGYAAPVVRASNYGARGEYASREAADELFLMVQCEHAEAVDNLAGIAAVDGVDMLFLGPNDLSASIDRLERMMDPDTQALIKRIEDGARQAGAMLGTITGAGRDWADLRGLGYRLVVGPNDVSLLSAGARAAIADRDRSLSTKIDV